MGLLPEILEPNWDHIPPSPVEPPKPPTKLALVVRKVMLAMRPEFTYGDERDRIQRQNARRAKRQIERDEAWAKKAEMKARRAANRKNGKGKGFGLKKAAGFMLIGGDSSKSKSTSKSRSHSKGVTSSSRTRVRPAATTPHGSSSNVKIYTIGATTTRKQPHSSRRQAPVPKRHPSAPNPRVVYTTRPGLSHSKSVPQASSRSRQAVPVRPTVRTSPSHQPRPPPPTRQASATQYVIKPAQPWAALQARVVTHKK